MTKTRRLISTLAFAAGLACLLPIQAHAAALIFSDTSASETITVSACDFEGGLTVNGAPVGSCGVGAGGSVTFKEADGPVSFRGSWIDLGRSGSGSRTIYLTEKEAPTLISDVFHYSWFTDGITGTIEGSFESDILGSLGSLPPGVDPLDVFVEDGRPAPFSLPFLSGELRSDVPEPVSLALVGLALAGIGLSRRARA